MRRSANKNDFTAESWLIDKEYFENFDALHFSVENQLLGLVRSLQQKRKAGTWSEELPAADSLSRKP